MPSQNGTAAASKPVGVLDLSDLAYERATIRFTFNGADRAIDGWVAGSGCPGRVSAEYARKLYDWQTSADGSGAPYIEFLTDALRVVLPDLSYEEADFLAGTQDRAVRILRHLKWFAPADQEASDDPEAGGGASTTDGSSPTSAPSTAASAPTAAAG